MRCLTCRATRYLLEKIMPKRTPGKLEHQRKVLEKRASIAKLQDGIRGSRLKLITARAELKSMRGR